MLPLCSPTSGALLTHPMMAGQEPSGIELIGLLQVQRCNSRAALGLVPDRWPCFGGVATDDLAAGVRQAEGLLREEGPTGQSIQREGDIAWTLDLVYIWS